MKKAVLVKGMGNGRPVPLGVTLGILKRLLLSVASFRSSILRYPPPWSDLVGCEVLLAWLKTKRIGELDGDVVEIGSFLGGGTAKLARFFGRYNKKVFAIDVFDPSFDHTTNEAGNSMSSLYAQFLRGRNQEDVFRENTRRYHNIVVLKGDSKQATLPCQEICFSFIDGCHDPDYVKNDFLLVWDKTVRGGVVGFHDYGGNLPQTTRAIDELIEANREGIREISRIEGKWIVLLTRK